MLVTVALCAPSRADADQGRPSPEAMEGMGLGAALESFSQLLRALQELTFPHEPGARFAFVGTSSPESVTLVLTHGSLQDQEIVAEGRWSAKTGDDGDVEWSGELRGALGTAAEFTATSKATWRAKSAFREKDFAIDIVAEPLDPPPILASKLTEEEEILILGAEIVIGALLAGPEGILFMVEYSDAVFGFGEEVAIPVRPSLGALLSARADPLRIPIGGYFLSFEPPTGSPPRRIAFEDVNRMSADLLLHTTGVWGAGVVTGTTAVEAASVRPRPSGDHCASAAHTTDQMIVCHRTDEGVEECDITQGACSAFRPREGFTPTSCVDLGDMEHTQPTKDICALGRLAPAAPGCSASGSATDRAPFAPVTLGLSLLALATFGRRRSRRVRVRRDQAGGSSRSFL